MRTPSSTSWRCWHDPSEPRLLRHDLTGEQLVRVMTWNLWWRFGSWEKRAAAIDAVVAEAAPDVLLLQEVWADGDDSAAHRLAARLGFHPAISDDPFDGVRRERGDASPPVVGFHNAIVSRWPLHDVASHPLPRLDGAPGHRRALTAVVDAPGGQWPMGNSLVEVERLNVTVLKRR